MTKYELARDKRMTIAALTLETLSFLSCALLLLTIFGEQLGIKTGVEDHLSWQACVGIVLGLQYALVATEQIVRFRAEIPGWTIPISFLPFGHIVRYVLVVGLAWFIAAFKLVTYFLSVIVAFILQAIRIDKRLKPAVFVDIIDRILEALDRAINVVYNALHFNKIHTNGNVFNTIFNGNLTMWCINH